MEYAVKSFLKKDSSFIGILLVDWQFDIGNLFSMTKLLLFVLTFILVNNLLSERNKYSGNYENSHL
jgi:hypothetical protein